MTASRAFRSIIGFALLFAPAGVALLADSPRVVTAIAWIWSVVALCAAWLTRGPRTQRADRLRALSPRTAIVVAAVAGMLILGSVGLIAANADNRAASLPLAAVFFGVSLLAFGFPGLRLRVVTAGLAGSALAAMLSIGFIEPEPAIDIGRSRAGALAAVVFPLALFFVVRLRYAFRAYTPVIFLGLVGCVVFLEAGLRLDGALTEPRHMQRDDGWDRYRRARLGNAIPPNVLKSRPEGWSVALGFTGWRDYGPVEKAVGVFRIVAIGGSSTEGLGVDREEDTWPYRLEQQLRAESGSGYEVFNAGRSGDTSFQLLMNLKHEIVRYEPDLVIVYAGYNDATLGNEIPVRRMFEITKNLPSDTDAETFRRVIAQEARRARAGESPVNRARAWMSRFATYRAMAGPIVKARHAALPEAEEAMFEYLEPAVSEAEYAENLREMIAIARERDFKIALVAEASTSAVERYHAVMRRTAKAEAVPFLDAVAALGACERPIGELLIDDVHFNPGGAACFARVLEAFLDAERLLTPLD